MNQKEISTIYNETLNSVFRYVYSRIGNKELTEDIVTETYLTFIDIADRYDGSSKIDTFIIGIARNKMHKVWDKQKLQKYVDLDIDSIVVEDVNEDDLAREEIKKTILLKSLDKVLNVLPKNYKQILHLRYKEMLTTEEIASTMDITVDYVRVLQHRALNRASVIANKLNLTIK
jgi:RNA polymerase sigma-70 factor, ECF subfamily